MTTNQKQLDRYSMNLYQKFVAVRSEIKNVQKTNKTSKFTYSNLGDINPPLKRALDKWGLVIILVEERPLDQTQNSFVEKLGNEYVWQSMGTVEIINADKPDEVKVLSVPIVASNFTFSYAHGSALTYSLKYLLKTIFNIDDGEGDPDDLADKFDKDKNVEKNGIPLPQKQTKKEINVAAIKRLYALGKQKGFDSDAVYNAIHKVIGAKHSADMSREEYDFISKSLESKPDVKEG